jgi:hypothetical protein
LEYSNEIKSNYYLFLFRKKQFIEIPTFIIQDSHFSHSELAYKNDFQFHRIYPIRYPIFCALAIDEEERYFSLDLNRWSKLHLLRLVGLAFSFPSHLQWFGRLLRRTYIR